MAYKVIAAVESEPVTAAEAKLQCKVDSDDSTWNSWFTAALTMAREWCEHYTGRALAQQTLEMALDCFPSGEDDGIDLDMPPVSSITSITYKDTAGDTQTVATSDYFLSTYGDSRRVVPALNCYWPTDVADVKDAVLIRYVTGACPANAKAAILLHIELEFPNNPLTPAERESLARARDSLLDTLKVY